MSTLLSITWARVLKGLWVDSADLAMPECSLTAPDLDLGRFSFLETTGFNKPQSFVPSLLLPA